MELEGKVIAVLQPREGTARSTGNPWKAQEYVIETEGQYPRKMCFEIFGEDRIKQNSQYLQMGNKVRVSFDIDAREWNGRYFNSIRAYRVDRIEDPVAQGASALSGVDTSFPPSRADPFPPTQPATGTAAVATGTAESDDLPF